MKICQARLPNSRLESQAFPAPLSLPQVRIGLSPSRVTSVKKLSLFLEPLLRKESNGRVVQLAKCLFGLGIQTLRHRFEPAEGHLL